MQFFSEPNINFMSIRKLALSISALLILVGIISLFMHGGPRLGIDFLGGYSFRLHFTKDMDIGVIRSALATSDFKNASIKKILAIGESGSDILIFLEGSQAVGITSDKIDSVLTAALRKDLDTSTNVTVDKKSDAVEEKLFTIESKEMVGPKIGGELERKAIWAILFSLLLILIYISFRFEFKFAVGAIVALFHDILITLGVFSLLDLEIQLAIVAAFLTIVGYSLNDTIVVFDRIRENLKKLRGLDYLSVINQSINQSLSRTIITSLTTLVVVVILYIFGGEVIKNFAFALIVGIVVGTYSSVFVASPVVIAMHQQSEARRAVQRSTRTMRPLKAKR